MIAKIVDYNRDFTSFLEDKVPHIVKIITEDDIVECSGMLLAQHSTTLKQLMLRDTEISLLGYTCISDLLTILYGGEVWITLENSGEIFKFGVEFGVPDVTEQVLNFLETKCKPDNVVEVMKVCLKVGTLYRFFGKEDEDCLWPCQVVVNKLNSEEMVEFVNSFQMEELTKMFWNKDIMARIIEPLSSHIKQDNVAEVLKMLQLVGIFHLVGLSTLSSKKEVALFVSAIENHALSSEQSRFLLEAKRSMFFSTGIHSSSQFKYDSSCRWESFTFDEMVDFVRNLKIDDFYRVEYILSWVSHVKPSQKEVQQLCCLVDFEGLDRQYALHALAILKNLGYEIARKLSIWLPGGQLIQRVTSYKRKNDSIVIQVDCCLRSYSTYLPQYFIEFPDEGHPSLEENKETLFNYSRYRNEIRKVHFYCKTAKGLHVPLYTEPLGGKYHMVDFAQMKATVLNSV